MEKEIESHVSYLQSKGLSPHSARSLIQLYYQHRIPVDYLRKSGLPLFEETDHLAPIQGVDSVILLEVECAQQVTELLKSAKKDGIELGISSGYRSYGYQAELVMGKRLQGMEWDEIFRVVAPPGCSEHHTGRAVDWVTPETMRKDDPLTSDFARSAAYQWLQRHAHLYGFRESYPPHNSYGIIAEPWHWCYQIA